MRRLILVLGVLAAVLVCGATPAAAQTQTYDAAADYSTTTATNGVWRYGYTQTLGSSLLLYTSNFDHTEVEPEPGRMNFWGAHGSAGDVTPVLGKNLESDPYYGTTVRPAEPVLGGQLALHPGPSGEFSVLRFVAPSAGNYRVTAQFFRGHSGNTDDIGDTDARILLNSSTAVFHALTTNDAPHFDGYLSLSANETVDFVVGSKGDHGSDTTPVNIVVTRETPDAVPEPGALALFLPALAAIALLRRRRAGDLTQPREDTRQPREQECSLGLLRVICGSPLNSEQATGTVTRSIRDR